VVQDPAEKRHGKLPHIEQWVVPSPGVAIGVREFLVWSGRINGPHQVNRMLSCGLRYCGTPGLSEARLKSCSTFVLRSADGPDKGKIVSCKHMN